jgi:hypothetical protein
MDAKALIARFNTEGYVVVPALFSAEEIAFIKEHFMAMNAAGHGFAGDKPDMLPDADPLKAFPRIIHSHRFDQFSLEWLLDERMRDWTTALLGIEPFAAQTMFYFKPPGARGQALHQDQSPLKVHPGTCLAAWMAVDDCDEENGCLQIVPRTQSLPRLCPIEADLSQSFSANTVPIPPGSQPEPVYMKAGDVVFFNGQVIHGSFPNRSETRFRRALIAHYIVGEAEKVAQFYHPILNFAGEEVDLMVNQNGGPCGVFAIDGEPAITMVEA